MAMRPGREADHSPPHTVGTKNEWQSLVLPKICLDGVDKNDLTFLQTL